MAQYDVHRLRDGDLVLDCQANFLDAFKTRIAIPLVDPDSVPAPLPRLHPLFEVRGEKLLLATHLVGAIPAGELGRRVGSLANDSFRITNAIDFLRTGV
jgi:toxin CcdB